MMDGDSKWRYQMEIVNGDNFIPIFYGWNSQWDMIRDIHGYTRDTLGKRLQKNALERSTMLLMGKLTNFRLGHVQ